MNAIFISADSLNRHFLAAYGGTASPAPRTPNIDRLAARSFILDRHYAGSLPCMPARREFLAGVQEFLWRPWGPIEPFDTSLALAARRAGVLTQLVTDHFHYHQHGSGGYCDDYHGVEFIRGHEVDNWRTAPADPDPVLLRQILADGHADRDGFISRAAYARNVHDFRGEEDFFPAKVFTAAGDWIQQNRDQSPWLLVIDSFDVHEPFHCPEPYASMYTDEDPRDPSLVVWPRYGRIDAGESRLTDRQLAFVRAQYAGKLTMWDRWFGTLLDGLDEHRLWDDTLVILTTDHGHYLGEHGWMGKPVCPVYDVLAHTPAFVHHPELSRERGGEHVTALTSAIDFYRTVLETFGVEARAPHSRSLLPALRATPRHRDWALYGYWGSSVNVTDGRFTYLHPWFDGGTARCYSTMFINPWEWFSPVKVPSNVTSGSFLPYSTGPVWCYESDSHPAQNEPLLYDVLSDPEQNVNLAGQGLQEERHMRELLIHALHELHAPAEQFERLGVQG